MEGSGQDWSRVVINSTGKGAGNGPRREKVAPEAGLRKDGGVIETEKKFNAGSNKKTVDGNMAKLDAQTEASTHKKVGQDLSREIQKARMDKGMTQSQLAQAINEKPAVVNQYESGKAIPNNQVISKMEKALGKRLRGRK
mmetsp:Transcript_17056/g.35477  ORF Transcript_17056/g.35477 Transcript_17056/m.35477 type:complete len:140 (-) Transcript_17056:967-1386(-)